MDFWPGDVGVPPAPYFETLPDLPPAPEPLRTGVPLAMSPAAVRLPRPTGPQITDRDRDILTWIGLHGIVTPDQVARHFFLRESGEVGKWAAYRRIAKMVELDLLQKDHVYWRHPQVLRLTGTGARFVDAGVGPAKLVMAQVPHALAVVDLLEQLRASAPRGTILTTERELRIRRRQQLAENPALKGKGRIPDAELQWSRKRIAVELDLTPKRSFDFERILHAYLQEPFDKVWWYVKPGVAERLRGIVRQNRAVDLVDVRIWEG